MYRWIILRVNRCCLAACKKPGGFEYRNIKDLKVESLGFDQSTISMNLVYFNPNNFGVNLKHVDCEVYVDQKFVGKYVLDTMMHISKKSEFYLPSKMNVDMRNLFKNALSSFFAQEVLLEVRGSTRLGKAGVFINVPFNYSGQA